MYRALLACVSCACTGLSKHGVGVEALVCLGYWDRGRACARGGGYVQRLSALGLLRDVCVCVYVSGTALLFLGSFNRFSCFVLVSRFPTCVRVCVCVCVCVCELPHV